MANITITQISAEPEETIEAALVAILAQSVTIPVEGALTPAATGTVKRLSSDTFVGVTVDQSSQDGDNFGDVRPFTYSVSVAVHYALADDADGSSFRDECRRTRSALAALSGSGCSAISTDAFDCVMVMVDSTATSFEGGDNPTMTKTYNVTVKGLADFSSNNS